MTIKFILLVNKQGQTRLSKYFDTTRVPAAGDARLLFEAEVVRKCLKRPDKDCNSVEHCGTRIIYRRYASLFFMIGVDGEDNELAILECIHCMVEAMDRWFGNVCELDIMFSLDMAYAIIDEMVANGWVVDTQKSSIIAPLKLLENM